MGLCVASSTRPLRLSCYALGQALFDLTACLAIQWPHRQGQNLPYSRELV